MNTKKKIEYIKKVIYSTKEKEHLDIIIGWISNLHLRTKDDYMFTDYYNKKELVNIVEEMKEYLNKGEVKDV